MPKAKTATFGQRGYGIEMPKASTYLADPKPRATEYEPEELWDQQWFITYREKVEAVLKKLGKVVTLPQIRKAMGKDYNDRYILDAVNASHHIGHRYRYPLDEFFWFERVKPPEDKGWNGANQLSISGRPKNVSADLGLQERVLA